MARGWWVLALAATGCGPQPHVRVDPELVLVLDDEIRVLDAAGSSATWARADAYGDVQWSWDGRWMAYAAREDNEWRVRIDDVETGERVADEPACFGCPFAWEPLGTRLAFSVGGYRTGGIMLVDAEHGELREITPEGSGDLEPVWSPDAKRLLLHRDRSLGVDMWGAYKIHVFDLETGEIVRLSDFDDDLSERFGRFSFDGSWVVFPSIVPLQHGELWAFGPAGTHMLIADQEGFGVPQPSPSTSEVLFGACDSYPSDCRIWLTDLERGDVSDVDHTEWGYRWWDDTTWAPDGRRLAFEIDRIAGSEVWVFDLDDRKKRLVATVPIDEEVTSMSWSPDGETLAVLGEFERIDKESADRRSAVYLLDVASGELELLHAEPRSRTWGVAWRPQLPRGE